MEIVVDGLGKVYLSEDCVFVGVDLNSPFKWCFECPRGGGLNEFPLLSSVLRVSDGVFSIDPGGCLVDSRQLLKKVACDLCKEVETLEDYEATASEAFAQNRAKEFSKRFPGMPVKK